MAAFHKNLPILISLLALAASFASLWWGVYREVFLKPRIRVRFGFSRVIMPNRVTTPFLKLAVLNLGPGSTSVVVARVRLRPFRFGWFRKENPGTAFHNWDDPFCAKLPAKLDAGDTIMITFPIEANGVLQSNVLRIGIEDSFNRFHWAPRGDVKKARLAAAAESGETLG